MKQRTEKVAYDVIGDIHGHAGELKTLLKRLGYRQGEKGWAHPEGRRVLFLGDYIDRGPKIRKTLKLVRSMVEQGQAIALLGRQEFHALCFHMEAEGGGHLRRHSIKNILQHARTLKQFKGRQQEYEGCLDWFKELPLFFEDGNLRAVHACWDQSNIDLLRVELVDGHLTDELIRRAMEPNSALGLAIEGTLKGREVPLPWSAGVADAKGRIHKQIRAKWWLDPAAVTYRSLSLPTDPRLPDEPVYPGWSANVRPYGEKEPPVFFGRYGLKDSEALFRSNICCLDHGVARKGRLVAYRFDGERTLDSRKLVNVDARSHKTAPAEPAPAVKPAGAAITHADTTAGTSA